MNFFQIFVEHGTIIRLHVQQIKLDYLARKCNIPVKIPSTETSIFLSFLPFPYFFLIFTLCILPVHIRFFLFSLSIIASFLCVCFKHFYTFPFVLWGTYPKLCIHILFLSCRIRLSTDYDRFTQFSSFHFNSLFTISSYNTLGSKLVHKQRQCLVLSQDRISLHCNNTDIHLTFKGSRKGWFRVPSCLFLHRNAVRPYLQRPGIDWRTPHNYSAPFTRAWVRRWSVPTCGLD
jgi:hypothetical protein